MSAMVRLRAATAARHARLERASGLPAGLLTRDDLVRTLETLHGFHAAVEAVAPPAAVWARLGLPHAGTSRSAWLAEDLGRLGRSATAVAALPRCPGLAPETDDSARLGRAYVVEGSALGGRVLHAHVTRRALVDAPLRFFTAHGADTGRLWRRFGEGVERRVRSEADLAAAVRAADATFDALTDWFAARAAARARETVRAP